MVTEYHSSVLVVGNGMVGHRFVEAAVERGLDPIVVVGEERRRGVRPGAPVVGLRRVDAPTS